MAEVEAKEVALEERVSSNQTLLSSHVKIESDFAKIKTMKIFEGGKRHQLVETKHDQIYSSQSLASL